MKDTENKLLNIFKMIAEGIDPFTRKPFQDDSIFRSASVIANIKIIVNTVKRHEAIIQGVIGSRSGEKWGDREICALSRSFKSGKSLEYLAKNIRGQGRELSRNLLHLGLWTR